MLGVAKCSLSRQGGRGSKRLGNPELHATKRCMIFKTLNKEVCIYSHRGRCKTGHQPWCCLCLPIALLMKTWKPNLDKLLLNFSLFPKLVPKVTNHVLLDKENWQGGKLSISFHLSSFVPSQIFPNLGNYC